MMTMEILPAAQQELEEAFDYYLAIDAELAHSFDQHYEKYRLQIGENPLLYTTRRGNARRVNLTPRFGEYYIAYMIWNTKVVILAVAHAKRRPYYWCSRVAEAKKMF